MDLQQREGRGVILHAKGRRACQEIHLHSKISAIRNEILSGNDVNFSFN